MIPEQYRDLSRRVFRKADAWEAQNEKGSARPAFELAFEASAQEELLVLEGHARNLLLAHVWQEWLERGEPLNKDRVDQVQAYYLKPRKR